MERRRRRFKRIPGLTRVHVFMPEDALNDLDWLAERYEDGNRSGAIRQLVADQMDREIRNPPKGGKHKKYRS